MRYEKNGLGTPDSVSSKIAEDLSRIRKKRFSGFTLAELIVVITILAILATIGFLALSGYSQDAKDSATKANVRSVQTAIASESAVSNNSPRYYIVHDSGAALSGAFVYLDNAQTALSGGDWNVPNTNYSAGNPDYAKLKLNAEKFKTASSGFLTAFAAYDPKYLSVWAMDATIPTASGKKRSIGYFQVAWISPATGTVSVSGNYPSSSGSVSGLVKDPAATSSTGALIDGTKSGSLPSCAVGYVWDYVTSSCLTTFVSATWGTVSTATIGGINYKIHKFTSGTSTFQVTAAPAGAKIEYLVVAWGGGGGYSGNGGGGGGWGAGWLLSSTGFSVSAGNAFSVSIGAGGWAGGNGGNTSFGAIVAHGGGAGWVGGNASGQSGGCGGGGNPIGGSYGNGMTWEGFRGGYVGWLNQGDNGAAGGGGAGWAGNDNTWSNAGTSGWVGLAFDISWISTTYAHGWEGGGGTYWYTGAVGITGPANSGNGGGGAGPSWSAGSGGSGIVIVRYQIP